MNRPYPTVLVLEGRRAVVVGGGPVATQKARALAQAGARLRVIAPDVCPELAELADDVQRREFVASDLDGAWFVVAAAPRAVNRAVRAAADERRVFVIAVDDTAHCSAMGVATLERSGVVVAISSGGRVPALVALLRRALDVLLPEDLDEWARIALDARAEWKSEGVPLDTRRDRLLRALNGLSR